ncbi:MAG TPA: DUF5710 domain-containing protein [Noviherbaspirillum sp.]|uniref:DUF5710 domain-containing protein n=1 Tax=Noviherbaspirillum sp. TaxID=1926288 RepID=UPI002D2ABD93|nr:DUF5710 domain-containing protein [Noviherbaspirillum sp.]HYD97228.1 DUF5710 domain-containing protein [Noviherbaspirillum sp.]
MTDAPPFDPPYFSVESTAQGVRVIETRADGSQQECMLPAGEAPAPWVGSSNGASVASASSRSLPKKGTRPPAGMPPGSTLIAVPFAEKDAAKKLGARWNAERRSWYVPPGTDASLFKRWRRDENDS